MTEQAEAFETAFDVRGMDCASCVSHVEKAARSVAGVEDVSVNLARGRAVVKFDPQRASADRIAAAITDSGYPAHAHEEHTGHENEHTHHARGWFWRAMIGVALWLPVETAHWILEGFGTHATHGWLIWLSFVTSTIAVGYIG